ncbi:hypothetical protein M408DRAFT_15909 [Serendipita vermifera MAFF 305830]|uniref:STEEP1 domain-containing protein n=1 Tax=Serendipita vermifera MAFF 305830 TaxID=933852 RepID=A0A0C3BDV8_SERVB|nr:hypothetical protein M408DRAFT_15909 [Serendipita vermifera MAFF 305830]
MPKVISRSTVSASTDAPALQSSTAALKTYYCICGEFILVVDTALHSLPRRQTDNAFIMRTKATETHKACIYKLNAKDTGAVLVQRPRGLERQIRMHCPRCNLPVAYRNEQVAPFIYIKPGALSLVQGSVPDDAFED